MEMAPSNGSKERGIMTILKKDDIEKQYTKIVSDLITAGYIIKPTLSNGTQSSQSITLIDPKNNSTVIRVYWLNDREDITYHTYAVDKQQELIVLNHKCNIKTVSVKIAKFDKSNGYDNTISDHNQTLWLSKGIFTYEKKFYAINKRKTDQYFYTDDVNEASKIVNIRAARCKRKECKSFSNPRDIALCRLPANTVDSLMMRINSIKGFKKANASCIKNVNMYKVFREYHKKEKLKCSITVEYNGKKETIYLS